MVSRLRGIRPGWEFDIFCRGSGGTPEPGVTLVHIPAIDRDGRMATLYARVGHRLGVFLRTRIDAECLSFTVSALPRSLRSRYDLIFNQAGPFAGRLLRMKRRLDGTPFIHETAAGHSPLELMMARQQPDVLIATSPFVGDWIRKHVPGTRIECLPKAVDRLHFRPYSADEMESARDGLRVFRMKRPTVLFVGAMDPMKRPELLISAMADLPEASLVMVGDGRLADEVARMGTETLGADRFLHVRQVSRDDIPLYYNLCDLMALPSEEPFGMVFLEAMACGKPVVGHRSPVQDWIFGDAGRTCDCTDSHELAATIRRVLSKGVAGSPRERSEEFDWVAIARGYERIFSSVIERRRGGAAA